MDGDTDSQDHDSNVMDKDSSMTEMSESKLLQQEREWIQRVVSGQNLVEALGSRRCHELATLRRYLAKRPLVDELLDKLSLSGQVERVNEVLGYIATQEALKSLRKGDRNVILALMPKAKGKATTAPKAAPSARALEDDPADKPK